VKKASLKEQCSTYKIGLKSMMIMFFAKKEQVRLKT
jgi:hypothetical protein